MLRFEVQCAPISALNEESVAYFRTSRWREGATGIECLYYQVAANGKVTLPLLGEIKVAGLTLEEIEVKLANELKTLLKEPKVRVRHVNYEISVMGEVNVPGNYGFEDGRVTLLEAISGAGGITQFGKRNNVLIIRDTPNGIRHVRIDLTKDELWDSEYYYLHQNDVVMVDSNPARVANAHNITTYGSVLVGLGTILAIFSTR